MPDKESRRLDGLARIRVTEHEGTRITWRSWGSGPPLVLLHGSAGSWTHWLRNIDALATAHCVHVPDLPGFGDSPAPPGPPTMNALAQALLAGIDDLEPDQRFALAGFSFGSIVAESMALARPDRVRHLVLVRGRYDGSNPAPPAGLKRWRGIADPAELAQVQRHNLAILMFHDPANIDAQAVQLQIDNTARAVLDLGPYGASRPADALAQISVPVAAFAGEHDCYAAPDSPAQRSALLASCPQVRYQLVAGAGHWANYEAAEAFNAALLSCLEAEPVG